MPASTTSVSTVACWVGPNPWASGPRQKTPALIQPSALFPIPTTHTSCGRPGAVEITNFHTGSVHFPPGAWAEAGSVARMTIAPRTTPFVRRNHRVRFAFMCHLQAQSDDSPTRSPAKPTEEGKGDILIFDHILER